MKSKYGRNLNKQQGTQRPTTGKSAPASDYSRSSQRASPSGSTPGFVNDYPGERARSKKAHKLNESAAKARRYLGGPGR